MLSREGLWQISRCAVDCVCAVDTDKVNTLSAIGLVRLVEARDGACDSRWLIRREITLTIGILVETLHSTLHGLLKAINRLKISLEPFIMQECVYI